MSLSQGTIAVLVDMIENKLSVMQISDREELKEIMTLKQCLKELRVMQPAMLEGPFFDLPRRGRRRKLENLVDDFQEQEAARHRAHA